ncbi:orotidine-5'-phosphate decarboxylase [Streptococcus entericus]|uniref:orotidine-5'-phosphate decarboxylase n=1 Tax=Streptococcus entericus TaxID=155680 RepID=UPI00037899F3|nr:orotidine-5'-phosphate decarboxylase [Streptococcus entericus]
MTKTILALDVSTADQAWDLLADFPEPIYVKVGMELYYALGADFVRELKAKGFQVFLDLKLHDIPNTVAQGMTQLATLGVDMLNVHAGGGIAMMTAAVNAVKSVNPDSLCIAVTILTSLDDQQLQTELGLSQPALETTLAYARNAKAAGMDGVVCSVHEVAAIHDACGADFICVTPGISFGNSRAADQKRVATPALAKTAGSDYIVVGRSISQSAHPYQTYLAIEEELL